MTFTRDVNHRIGGIGMAAVISVSHTASRVFGNVTSATCRQIGAIFVAFLFLPSIVSAEEPHPLEPLDTSSPGSTIYGLIEQVDRRRSARKSYGSIPATEDSSVNGRRFARFAPSTCPKCRWPAALRWGCPQRSTCMRSVRLALPPREEIPDAEVLCRPIGPPSTPFRTPRSRSGGSTRGNAPGSS